MKPRSQTPHSSDSSRVGCEEVEQAQCRLTPIIDEFLGKRELEQQKILVQDLMEGRVMPETDTHEFCKKIDKSGIEISLPELANLVAKRMQGFEDTKELALGDLDLPSYKPRGVIDHFLEEEITGNRREVMRIYVSLTNDAVTNDAALERVAVEEKVPLESLRDARDAVQVLIRKTGADADIVKKGIVERLQNLSPADKSSPVQTETGSPSASQSVPDEQGTLVSELPLASNNLEDDTVATAVQEVPSDKGIQPAASPQTNHIQSSIMEFVGQLSEVEKKTLLPAYWGTDRKSPEKVMKLITKYGERALELDRDLTLLAEKLGCKGKVEAIEEAVTIVLKGGNVVADHLHRQKVIINPEAHPRTAKTVLISRGESRTPILARVGGVIRHFLKKED